MVLKRAKCDLNGVKIVIFPVKSKKSLNSWGSASLWQAWVAAVYSARDLNQTIFGQKIFTELFSLSKLQLTDFSSN